MATNQEILDVLDINTGQKTGQTVPRNIAHREGIPHKAIHLWLFSIKDGEVMIYFQQRSYKKPNFPGIFVAPASGHVQTGEGMIALVREAEEEIGFTLNARDPEFLEYHPYHLIQEGYLDYEWIEEYATCTDWSLTDFQFKDGEVIAVAAIYQRDLALMIENPDLKIQGDYFDGETLQQREFSKEDFLTSFLEMGITKKLVKWKCSSGE